MLRRLVIMALLASCLSCISKDDILDKIPYFPDKHAADKPDGAVSCEPFNKLGFDLLGLLHPNYDAVGISHLLPPNSFIGLLDGSFGTDTKNLELLLSSGRVGAVRVHLLNTVCLRNHNCGESDNLTEGISPEDFSRRLRSGDESFRQYVTGRVRVYRELSNQYPCVKFFISPMLEHNEDGIGFRRIAEWISSEFNAARLVNNPQDPNNYQRGQGHLECHGRNYADGCKGYSFDGTSIRTVERQSIRAVTSRASYQLGWFPEANCRPADGAFIPIAERSECMTAELFKELLVLTYE